MRQIVVFLVALTLCSTGLARSERTYRVKHHKHHHSRGLKRHEEWRKHLKEERHSTAVATPLPKSATVVPCSTQVENQGSCGSCWDFSLTGTLRDSLACNGPKDPGRLSFNYLLDCATEQSGCGGGDFNAAQHFNKPAGPPTYDSWPYTGSGGRCQKLPVVASANAYHMLGDSNGNVSFRDIAYVIAVLHQPVSIDVAADNDWESYDGGVYNGCSDNGINHMVIISAYDCETSVDQSGNCSFDQNGNLPPGVGIWTIKNSWGTSWGEDGYMRSKATDEKGRKCNAAATDALYFDVDPKDPVPVPVPNQPQPDKVPSESWIIVGALILILSGFLAYSKLSTKTSKQAQRA